MGRKRGNGILDWNGLRGSEGRGVGLYGFETTY